MPQVGIVFKLDFLRDCDILIFSKDFDQHLDHLNEVFDRLRSANLRLKPSKCKFATPSGELSQSYDLKGMESRSIQTSHVQSKNSPHQSDTTQLRGFIGLCNYYRRFIRDFAHIATPLNKLLQQDEKFTWSNECQQAFDYLKNALTSEPIMLPFPDFSKEFILYTGCNQISPLDTS